MIHQTVVIQFSKMLGNLAAILGKAAASAEERGFDTGILLRSRLAPDQLDLTFQIRTACDTAKLGASRLAGKDDAAPVHADDEQTLAELEARIASVVTYLKSFTAGDFAATERRITQPRWKGKSLSGEEFLIQHVIPNFYFHITTAYAILRHNGVAVGKKDYLGDMPYRD